MVAREVRSGTAAVASSLVPGWGQLLGRRRTLGIVLITIDIVAVSALLIMWLWYPSAPLEAWVTPSALTGIIVGNIAILLYRGGAAVDSFLAGTTRSVLDWVLGAVAVGIVLVPHVMVGSLVSTQIDLLASVFPTEEPVAAPAPSTTTGPTVPESSTPPPASTSTLPRATTTTPPPRVWDGLERLNIMLLGSDAGVGRIGTRTDTIIVLSVEPESGDVAMFSVPRNLTEAPLPEGMGRWDCNCFPDIITHLWANGEWYPDAFPGPQSPSINALKATLGLIFGVDIHYYAKVDLVGFVGIIDAVGGVTMDVPKRIIDETYPHEDGGTEYIVFEEGEQWLDGHRALAYARIRRHSGDFARMHRQRCLIGSLVEQTSVLDILTGYDDLAEAVKAHVETDIPVDRLGDFVELLSRMETDRFGTLRITRYNYGAGGHAGYQLYDLDRIKADAGKLMADPTVRLESQDGDDFDATCDQSFD